ncbi:hypothetical protein ANCDUO_08366 [Ancylostoma duodenale]|uniref:Uncharacterized protein n=1 Tax=Ancylostoma duodenale TaxID=51022 RepID=A0A0C2GJK9_9BILA|nr:hypothetical protein ANCDUO_08366 [Ancylostoma duodenale]
MRTTIVLLAFFLPLLAQTCTVQMQTK